MGEQLCHIGRKGFFLSMTASVKNHEGEQHQILLYKHVIYLFKGKYKNKASSINIKTQN